MCYSDLNGCQSYISLRGTEGFEAIAEACSFDSNDFTYDFKEECQYICAYEYPLASLEYSEKYITLNGRQYYNRASIDGMKESGKVITGIIFLISFC